MDITRTLEELERINHADVEAAREFGPLQLGPRGLPISEVTCLDGATSFPASPQIREFYSYAAWWKHCAVALEWCDLHARETGVTAPAVRNMIDADVPGTDPGGPGLERSSTVLFALDDRADPYERAYLTFGESVEPRAVQAGSEVTVYADLAGYLESWLTTLRSR